jgi:hypothetical protein
MNGTELIADRVLILGGGMAGVACAQKLGDEGIDVVLVDRNDYHQFQPLLYQVASSQLPADDIARPHRMIFADYPTVTLVSGQVAELGDPRRRGMGFCERWWARLPLPLTDADRTGGYWWDIAMRQVEVSRTIVFDAPRHARGFFEALCTDNLDIGRPEQRQLVFGRRVRTPPQDGYRTRLLRSGDEVSLNGCRGCVAPASASDRRLPSADDVVVRTAGTCELGRVHSPLRVVFDAEVAEVLRGRSRLAGFVLGCGGPAAPLLGHPCPPSPCSCC